MRLLNWLFGKLLYYIPNSNLIWKQIPERNLRVGKEQHKHVIRTGEYLSLSIHIAEKKMATHASTLARKILWMEEPGGLQSMRSQRVRHDWPTTLSLFTFIHIHTHTHKPRWPHSKLLNSCLPFDKPNL